MSGEGKSDFRSNDYSCCRGGVVTPVVGFAIGTVGIIGGVVVTLACVLYLTYCAFGIKVTSCVK